MERTAVSVTHRQVRARALGSRERFNRKKNFASLIRYRVQSQQSCARVRTAVKCHYLSRKIAKLSFIENPISETVDTRVERERISRLGWIKYLQTYTALRVGRYRLLRLQYIYRIYRTTDVRIGCDEKMIVSFYGHFRRSTFFREDFTRAENINKINESIYPRYSFGFLISTRQQLDDHYKRIIWTRYKCPFLEMILLHSPMRDLTKLVRCFIFSGTTLFALPLWTNYNTFVHFFRFSSSSRALFFYSPSFWSLPH